MKIEDIKYTELSAIRNAFIHADDKEPNERALLQGEEDQKFREWESKQGKIIVRDVRGGEHEMAKFYVGLRQNIIENTEMSETSGHTLQIINFYSGMNLKCFDSVQKYICKVSDVSVH